jgi:hypothetical protein
MIHKSLGKYENGTRTCLGTLAIPLNDDKMNNFLGSNNFGKYISINNPTGSQYL